MSEQETDVRLGRPVFQKLDLPEPSPEEVRKYKSHLTRLSKARAFEDADKNGFVSEHVLRQTLIGKGEISFYLDESWAKRVFSDKELFEPDEGGFWKVVQLQPEEKPTSPGRWTGPRPMEDVLGRALSRAHEDVSRADIESLNPRSRYMEWEEAWSDVHRAMLNTLSMVRAKGVEKPLNELQERAFAESLLDPDPAVQIIACWLLNTRALVDVMQRFAAVAKVDGPRPDPFEIAYWGPPVGGAHTLKRTLDFVRRLLLNRGILGGKKQ